MSNVFQKIGAGAGAFAAAAALSGPVNAAEFRKPSLTFPDNNHPETTLVVPAKAASLPPSSPTNPNPPKGDQARTSVKPLFIAQVPRQIAQTSEPRTPPLPPENYGTSGAKVIVELQEDINEIDQIIKQDDQNLVNQAQQTSDRFQQFLRNRQ
jgi:hypothetical protein